MTNNSLTKNVIESAIKATNGQFFTVIFRKKNGKMRKMNCRLGVKKHLRSGASSTTSHMSNYITVFDMVAREYRTINLDTIKEFRGNGTVLKVA